MKRVALNIKQMSSYNPFASQRSCKHLRLAVQIYFGCMLQSGTLPLPPPSETLHPYSGCCSLIGTPTKLGLSYINIHIHISIIGEAIYGRAPPPFCCMRLDIFPSKWMVLQLKNTPSKLSLTHLEKSFL